MNQKGAKCIESRLEMQIPFLLEALILIGVGDS